MNRRILVILLVSVAIAAAAYYRFQSDDEAGGGPPIVDVIVPALSAEASAGEALFAANCARCHGDNASGRQGLGPPLVHKIYEPNHHGDVAFQLAARQGVRQHHWPFGDMPPVDGVSDADIDKIIFYVRELQRANGIN